MALRDLGLGSAGAGDDREVSSMSERAIGSEGLSAPAPACHQRRNHRGPIAAPSANGAEGLMTETRTGTKYIGEVCCGKAKVAAFNSVVVVTCPDHSPMVVKDDKLVPLEPMK